MNRMFPRSGRKIKSEESQVGTGRGNKHIPPLKLSLCQVQVHYGTFSFPSEGGKKKWEKKKSAFYMKFYGFFWSLTSLTHIFKKHWTGRQDTTTASHLQTEPGPQPTNLQPLSWNNSQAFSRESLAFIRIWFTFQAVDHTHPRNCEACGSWGLDVPRRASNVYSKHQALDQKPDWCTCSTGGFAVKLKKRKLA